MTSKTEVKDKAWEHNITELERITEHVVGFLKNHVSDTPLRSATIFAYLHAIQLAKLAIKDEQKRS